MCQRFIFLRSMALLSIGCIGMTGCSHEPAEAPQPTPPTVTVTYPLKREVTEYAEFPGRTAAVDSVQVRARVSGYLQQVNFKDGADVEQGDVLYEIDPRPYQAALEQAKAVDIFVQIGLLVLVGLASKNAILIVEFARDLRGQGEELHRATLGASKIRFRPIIMTSLAFISGVLPLVLATGAGAEMRQSLGTAVFSGMIGVTLFGIFLTPVFFFVLLRLGERRRTRAAPQSAALAQGTGDGSLRGLAGERVPRGGVLG